MKIVCDACQAKYSISDDKVQGKVFKIRCKKCSNIIVVRGGAGAAEPAPAPQQEKDTRVYDYGYEGSDHAPAGDEAVWHVVINQDQVGPMTAVDVQQRFASAEIDSETYVWREGFADWLPMAQVDTFASLVASGAGSAAVRGSGADAVASMFGDDAPGRSDPGDLFAAASAGNARHDDDGSDLFGSKPSAAQPAAGPRLRGERNENSVLFSLNNLAQLASDKPPAAAAHAATAAVGNTSSGPSGGEGSGLIDIRSMASAYLGGPGGNTSKPASAGIGSIDDLPVFGGGGFSEPAVIVPITARANNNKLMYALIGSVGLLVVAAAIVVVVLIRGGSSTPTSTMVAAADKDKTEPPADKAAVQPPAEPKQPEAAPTTPPPSDVTPPDSGDTRPKDVKAATDNPADAKRPPPATTTHKAPSPTTTTTTAPATPRPPRPAEKAPPIAKEPPPPPRDTGKDSGKDSCDEVSCVLNNYEGACCAKFKRGGSKPAAGGTGGTAPKSDLPESLDRGMISDGVSKVKARVMSCGEKSPAKGQVKVSVKVSPEGHVTSVTVKNTPDVNLGNCVQNMVQKAMFAKTQTGGAFSYPYTF
jgi:predicted Zn finger-like uncharacterized protein